MLGSNASSTGTRESAQDSTAANGSCFATVFCLKIARSSSSEVRRFSTKALFPSTNVCRASSGERVVWANARSGNAAKRCRGHDTRDPVPYNAASGQPADHLRLVDATTAANFVIRQLQGCFTGGRLLTSLRHMVIGRPLQRT
jgi:hypothetical protein